MSFHVDDAAHRALVAAEEAAEETTKLRRKTAVYRRKVRCPRFPPSPPHDVGRGI